MESSMKFVLTVSTIIFWSFTKVLEIAPFIDFQIGSTGFSCGEYGGRDMSLVG